MRRQIENELYIPEITECITADHELNMNLFSTSFSRPPPQWFRYEYNCKLVAKAFSSIFDELLQRQSKNLVLSARANV